MGSVESQVSGICPFGLRHGAGYAYEVQVLDEADRLLTPTFAPELTHLFNALPKERQTCLFTATLTPSIESLIEAPPRAGKQKPYVHRMSAA